MSLFKAPIDIPPMFVDQLVHVILRNILDGADDPLRLRAAEIFFREQKATIQEGHALLADLETVEMHASGNRYGSIGRLIVEAQGDLAKVDLDVLDRANAALYWERESRHDTVISVTYGRPALDALCRVIEAWVLHFLGLEGPGQAGAQDRRAALGLACRPRRRVDRDPERAVVGRARSSRAACATSSPSSRCSSTIRRRCAPTSQGARSTSRCPARTAWCRMKPQNLLTNLPLNEA